MPTQPRGPESVQPFLYALAGTVLLAIAGVCLANVSEGTQLMLVLTMLFGAPGLYLLVAGAVARGIFVAGR